MNNTVFLNRKLEKENIKNYLLKNKNNPYVLFIASTTGVGKTSLINKVIQDTKIQNFLRVTSTNDKNNRDRDGFIIKQMVKSVFFQKTQEKCNSPSQLISDLKAIVLEYINSKLNSQTLEKNCGSLF